MSKFVSIKYLWWIEGEDKESKKITSLTWSATLVEIDDFLWIIDYWMFQWWKNDDEKNSEVFENAEDLDFAVLTHAHLDHCWRFPLLVKNWFSWPIYTTKLTWLQAREMLLDYVRIMKSEIKKSKKFNKKSSKKFKDAKFLVENYEKLVKNSLSREDREEIKRKLSKKFSDSSIDFLKDLYEEAKEYLSKNEQISLRNQPNLLFDESDVEKTFSLFKFIDNSNELTIKENISFNSSDITLDRLLSAWIQSSDEKISLPISVYNKIKSELEERIINTKRAIEENENIKKRNEEKWIYWILTDEEDFEIDIENYYDIPHSLEELYALKRIIEVWFFENEEDFEDSNFIKSIKLRFFDAGHIEWSSQVLLTIISQNSKNISSILDENSLIPWFRKKTENFTNLLFSGDLWRINNPNTSWKPVNIPYSLDYAQIESTYAWRFHSPRQEAEKRFFEELEKSEWKVLIPAFSIQRTQEVLLMILNEMKKNLWDLKIYKELKAKLKKLKKVYESIQDKNTPRAESIYKTISFLEKDIFELKKSSIVFQDIIVDSPLSIKITSIYKNDQNIGKKYDLLNPEKQTQIFGREVIKFISSKKEQSKIYDENRKSRKEVIVSSSWMCEWWSILFHLSNILHDKSAKIVFVWYCPWTTNWWKIKSWEKIFIDGVLHEVSCQISDLEWFSAHLDESEILDYLSNTRFKRWAKLSLTHGWESRNSLAEKISKQVDDTRKKISVIIPNLYDEIKIKI